MTHLRLPLAMLTVLAAFLAACSAPQGPTMSAAETGAAMEEVWQAGFGVGSDEAWSDLPLDAIAALSTAGLPAGDVPGTLPRGVYEYDQITEAWVETGASDDLELNWLYVGVAHGLTVDWDKAAPTIVVELPGGGTQEAPVGAEATFLAGGTEVGGLVLGSTWTSNQCGYQEPTGVSLSAYAGDAEAMLTLDRLAFTIADTAGTDVVTAAVEATATVGNDSLSAYLDLSGRGELGRDANCAIVDFTPASGTVALGAAVSVDGDRRSIDLRTEVDDVVIEAGSSPSVSLNGDLRIDGVVAVSFVGALDDANGNGVPGDSLQLTFTGQETMSLETFLVDRFGWAPVAALRLLAR